MITKTGLFTNGIITLHDYKKPMTAILMVTVTQGDNTGKTLGLWMGHEELLTLQNMIDEYLKPPNAEKLD